MKKLEEMITNLAHVKTCQNHELDSCEFEFTLFGNLDLITQSMKNKNTVSYLLQKEKELIHLDVPVALRLEFFKKLNTVLLVVAAEYSQDEGLFHVFFDLMSLFKNKIDDCPQGDWDESEKEWLELEKSVYVLCGWEDAVSGKNPSISRPSK